MRLGGRTVRGAALRERAPWQRMVPIVLGVLALAGASCSGSPEETALLGRQTVLESVDEASDGILEVPGEDTAADVALVPEEPTMFTELDALIRPAVPRLSGAVDAPQLSDGDTIFLGGLVTETIDGSPVVPGICNGALARLSGALTRGEIAWPVEWLGCADDAGFSDRTENALNRLRFRRPFAIVPLMSDRFFSEQLLNDEFVPYIGIGSQPAFCDVTNSFGFAVTGAQGCPVIEIVGYTTSGPVLRAWLDAIGQDGEDLDGADLTVAIVVDTSVSGTERARSRALEVGSVGAQLVLVDDTLPSGAAAKLDDLDRVARGIAVQLPDVVIVEIAGAHALYPRLRAAGYTGYVVGVELDPALLAQDSDLAASFVDTWQVIAGVSVLPEAPMLVEDAAAAEVDATEIGLGFVSGYASMDFFIAALAGIEGPVGPVELRDHVNSGWTYPGIPGAVCASAWPTAHLSSVPCASVVHVNESAVPRQVLPPTEYPLLISEVEG